MREPDRDSDARLVFEKRHWRAGFRQLAGIDEAGRGPLAGPVVAAAVCIERRFLLRESSGVLAGLNDSKQLSAKRREAFFDILSGSPAVRMGIGVASAAEIDAVNILVATHRAMGRAAEALGGKPDHFLVDGRAVPGLPSDATFIIGGDGRSLLIAAASVVAKVVRDRHMVAMEAQYPGYGFSAHKGYGSRAHMEALYALGPCPVHRRSFRPVQEAGRIRAHARQEASGHG